MMSKNCYFSSYKSPNIVIVPSLNENIPPLKRAKINNDVTETTQISKKNNNTVIEPNYTQTMPVNKNVTEKKNVNNKKIPSVDSEHNGHQKMEEKAKQINIFNHKIENKINSKSKIKNSDSSKTSKKYIKEMSTVRYDHKCVSTSAKPEILKKSIDKGSENFRTTSRIIKEPLQKSKAFLIKHNKDNKMKNKTEGKSSKKNNETDKYSKHSSPKEDDIQQKLECSQSKMLKSDTQGGTIDTNINKNKMNSNVNWKSLSKKSNLCRQTKMKVDKHNKIKTKTRKIIKIVINVTYNKFHERDNAKVTSGPEYDKNPDLSFLDDFDVDEVVDSLFSCKNTKTNINERIPDKTDVDNSFKKSSTKMNKENKMSLKLTKTGNNAIENNLKGNKHEVQHISGNMDKLGKISHGNNRSLEKVINQIRANDQNNYKKVVKILQPKTNNLTETKKISKKSELGVEKPKNQLMVCKNIICTKESSKDFSSSDSYNVTVKEKKNVMNAVNIQNENIYNECSLMKKNEYHSDEVLSLKLEIKMHDLLMEKCSINTVAHHGKFSKIFKCTNMVTGKIYAIKILNKCDYDKGICLKTMLQNIQREIPKENLFCIYLKSSFMLNRQWSFVTYYYSINLQQVLQDERKYFHIDEIRNLSKQLLLALIVVRNKNIVHSDIKPSHILLNSDLKELKLCGFDEAYDYYCSEYPSPYTGTVNYRAPEIILGYSNGFSIDIWSLALVMYEMVTSHMLFPGETNNEVLYKQISAFGMFPSGMLLHSRFKKDHFVGSNFVRNGYCDMEKGNIINFGNVGGVKEMIMDGYEKHWGKINTNNEILHLNLLCRLLQKMFILDPKYRLSVEYVYANPFFITK